MREYLHRSELELWTPQNRLVEPVIVLDQFEELFTLGRAFRAEVAAFRDAIADLAENRIPREVEARLERGSASDTSLEVQTVRYKIVISLREDFLADLESWRLSMPSLRRNRMRLLPMGVEQARQAMFNEHTDHLMTESIASTIVRFVAAGTRHDSEGARSLAEAAGASVEPALLSLFCRGINEQRKRAGKARFDDALLEGAKGTIVADFYRACVADKPDRVRHFIEEQLITEQGFRNSYSVEDALARGYIDASELRALVDRRLLRQEHHLGIDRVELTHDLLTRTVLEERDRRRLGERLERERESRRRMRRNSIAAGSIALMLLASTIGTFVAWQRARRAEQQAQSRALVAIAQTTTDDDPALGMLLALEGLRIERTPEARSALLEAARYMWTPLLFDEQKNGGQATAIALNGDGGRLAILAGRGLNVWDLSTEPPRLLGTHELAHDSEGNSSLAFSPNRPVLAVGFSHTIELLDANTARRIRDPIRVGDLQEAAVHFSPDGQWLAWLADDEISLLEYQQQQLGPRPPARVRNASGFVVLDGNLLLYVNDALELWRIELNESAGWTETGAPDPTACVRRQSISVAKTYISATWQHRLCTSTAKETASWESDQRAIADIVWSAEGGAYAAIPIGSPSELVVGRGNPGERHGERRIKGVKHSDRPNLENYIAVNELATRVAVITEGERSVRIYSRPDPTIKPFMNPFPLASVASDGSVAAVLAAAISDEADTAVSLIPLRTGSSPSPSTSSQLSFSSPILASSLPTRPEWLDVTPTSIIVSGQSETAVFDRTTGERRFRLPSEGPAVLLGDAELMLISARIPPEQHESAVYRVQDGEPIARWSTIASAGKVLYAVSPLRSALAVLIKDSSHSEALVYRVQGARLTSERKVRLDDASQSIDVSDDARSIAEHRHHDGTMSRRWSLLEGVLQPSDWHHDDEFPCRSGGGKSSYRLRRSRSHSGTLELVSRDDEREVLVEFPAADDCQWGTQGQYLAMWNRGNSGSIRVVDMAHRQIALELELKGLRDGTFQARDTILRVTLEEDDSRQLHRDMLIPLDFDLVDTFAQRLLSGLELKCDQRRSYAAPLGGCHTIRTETARN